MDKNIESKKIGTIKEELADTDIKDLPLNIEIMKIKRSISPQKYDVDSTTFNDVLQVPRKVMSIVAFLEIEIDLITDMENSLNAFLKEL